MELAYAMDYDEAAEYEAWSATVDQEMYETAVIEPCCDVCNAYGRGTQKGLESMNWKLSAAGEYCPSH